ncbi:hypothetical protein H4R34_002865 [Dimargaris verticillata]|uniref:Uncharacterized protein n=1 Tax=Dimargaris verticillata TaxID=2761393 RepID=A0A9W8ED67_9FUNG|nr:hypothetical protein H4R34_002865 [Dimargaris verticillata]
MMPQPTNRSVSAAPLSQPLPALQRTPGPHPPTDPQRKWSYQSSSPRYPFLYANLPTVRTEQRSTSFPGTPQQRVIGTSGGKCQTIPAVVSAISSLPPAKSLVHPPPAPVLRPKRSMFSLDGLAALLKTPTLSNSTPRKGTGFSSAGISSASYVQSATDLPISRPRNPEYPSPSARHSWRVSSSESAYFELPLAAAGHSALFSREKPQSCASSKAPLSGKKAKKRGKPRELYALVDDDDDNIVLDDATSDLLMGVMDYKGYSRYPTCLRPRRDRLRQLRQPSPRPDPRSLPNLTQYHDDYRPVARCVSYGDPSTNGMEQADSPMPGHMEAIGRWPYTTSGSDVSSLPANQPCNHRMTSVSQPYPPFDQAGHSRGLPHSQGWSAPTSPRRLRSKPLPPVPRAKPSTPLPDVSALKLTAPVAANNWTAVAYASPLETNQSRKFSSSFAPVGRKPMSPVIEENESAVPSQASFDSAVSVSMVYAGEPTKSFGFMPAVDDVDADAGSQSQPGSLRSQRSLCSVVAGSDHTSGLLPSPTPQPSFYHPHQSPQFQSKPIPEPLGSISGMTDIPFQTNSVRSRTAYHGEVSFGQNLGNQSPSPPGSPVPTISNTCSLSAQPLVTTDRQSASKLTSPPVSKQSLHSDTSSFPATNSAMLSAPATPCLARKALPLTDHASSLAYSEASREDEELTAGYCAVNSARDASLGKSVEFGASVTDNSLRLKSQTSRTNEAASFSASVYRGSRLDGADDWDALRASMFESMPNYQPRSSPSRPRSQCMSSMPDGGFIDCYRTPTPSSPRTRVALHSSPVTPSKDEDSFMGLSMAASPNISYLQLTPHRSKDSPIIGYRTQNPVSRDGMVSSPSLCRHLPTRPISRSQSQQPSTAIAADKAFSVASSSTSALLMPLSERPVRVKPKEWSGPHTAKTNRVRPPQFPRLTPSDSGIRQPLELVRKDSFCAPSRSASIVRFSPASSIRYCRRARVKELADFFAAKY